MVHSAYMVHSVKEQRLKYQTVISMRALENLVPIVKPHFQFKMWQDIKCQPLSVC